MNRGMRLVIDRATLAAAIVLAASSAFAQPWIQQQQRRMIYLPAPQQRLHGQQPPQRQAAPPPRPAQPEPLAQSSQSSQPKGACFAKETAQDALISACTAIIE